MHRSIIRQLIFLALALALLFAGSPLILARPPHDTNSVGGTPHYVIFISGWQCLPMLMGGHNNSDEYDPTGEWDTYRETFLGPTQDVQNSSFFHDIEALNITEDKLLYYSYSGEWEDDDFQDTKYTYSDTSIHNKGPDGAHCPDTYLVEEEIELPLGRTITYSKPHPLWFEKGNKELFDTRAGYLNQMIEGIRNKPGNENARFTVIGHSQGGIIATYWAGSERSRDYRQYVETITTLHSPLKGEVATFLPFLDNPLDTKVIEIIAEGPKNLPIYTIRHKNDLIAPGAPNDLESAWLDLQYANKDPDSAEAVVFEWGDNKVVFISNHGTGKVNKAIARSVAVAMVGGAVMTPDSSVPYQAGEHNVPYKWLNNAFAQGPIGMTVPAYRPVTQGTRRHSKLNISIDGTSVGKVVYVKERDPNKEGKLGIFDSLDGQDLEWRWATIIKNPPVVSSPGLKDLQLTTQNVHLTSTDVQTDSIEYGGQEVGGGADIVEVIDVSGSMRGEKLVQAKNAAELLVALTTDIDQIGIVRFSTSADTVFPLSPATPENRETAKAQIRSLTVIANTSIGAGLLKALEQYQSNGSPTKRDTIVLLSDGRETADPRWNDVRQDVIESGVEIYTIGLGDDADPALLQQIASATGGQFFFTPSPQELQQIYDNIVANIQGRQTFQANSGQLPLGQSNSFSVNVDGATTQVRFVLNWPNAGANLRLEVTDPSGQLINEQNYQNYSNVSFTSGDTYKIFDVSAPQAGEWQYTVSSNTSRVGTQSVLDVLTPEQSDDFSVSVNGVSDLFIVPLTESTETFRQYEPIDIGVALVEDEPLAGVLVQAHITRPDGSIEELELTESPPSISEGNGEYQATYLPLLIGSYTIKITASGTAPDGMPFERAQTFSLFVADNPESPADVKVSVASVPNSTANGITEYCLTYGNNGPVGASTTALSALIEDGYLESSDIGISPDDPDTTALLWQLGTLASGSEQVAKLRIGAISDTIPSVSVTLFDVTMDGSTIDLTNASTQDPNLGNNRNSTHSEVQMAFSDGWSLVTLPRQPTVKSPLGVFCPFSGSLNVVLGFDGNGLTYDPNLPQFSSLKEIYATNAYWIRTTGNALLNVSGKEVVSNEPIYLQRGWNLVGYLPDFAMDIDTALASIQGKYDKVLGYDEGAMSFYTNVPPQLNTLNALEPGLGYWIHMLEPARLQYPFEQSQQIRDPKVVNRPQIVQGIASTSEWVNIFSTNSTYNGQSLPVHTVITAIGEDGRKLGEMVVRESGSYGVLSVYRDDSYTAEVDGARRGEQISFLINGQPATITNGASPTWSSNGDLIEVDLAATGPTMNYMYLPMIIQ